MKKIISIVIILTILLCSCVNAPVSAFEKNGDVYTTDIGALIDEQPIKSYNYQDHTYICAEDLRGYGFDVDWNNELRTLSIEKNNSIDRTSLSKDEINILKSDIPLYTKIAEVYSTDIKTYLSGELTEACNIDGKTLIQLSALNKYGYVEYDDNSRLAKLNTVKYQLDNAFETAENKTELVLGNGITYYGQTKNGVPHGIGKRFDKSVMSEFPGTISDMEYLGYFTEGTENGFYYESGTEEYTIGSYIAKDEYITFGNKELGDNLGFQHSYSTYHFRPTVNDSTTSTIDRRDGFIRSAVIDSSYLYGINVSDLSVINNGDLNVSKCDYLPKFDRFGTNNYSEISVIDENDNLYTAPFSTDSYKNAVYRRRNILDGNYSENWLLAKDNKLYIKTSNDDTEDVCTVENAVSASYQNYIDTDGTLWEDVGYGYKKIDSNVKQFSGQSYVIYLKNDGSVWTYRSAPGPGSEWIDKKDYSAPVKRADNAMSVATDGNTYYYIKQDGSLWGFGASYGGQLGYIETYSFETYDYLSSMSNYTSPVKLGDGFINVKAANNVCYALKSDGSLWGAGENEYGHILTGSDENNVLNMVKIADDVKDFAGGSSIIYIIKTDGSLLYRGKPYYRSMVNGEYKNTIFSDFTRCDAVYEPVQ